MSRPAWLLLVLAALLAGCGGSGGRQAPTVPTATGAPLEGCGSVAVPGHRATAITATAGIGCSVAVDVAADAEGHARGRYLSTGFACVPGATTGGRTAYTCRQAERRIAFRYGPG